MTTDYRALCAELLDELSGYASANPHHDSDALVARARAALDEPVAAPARPTDEELREVWCEGWNTSEEYGAFKFARAVLARWGRPYPATAEGEVAELVAELRMMASQAAEACQFTDAESLSSAADLLEQRHPVPVPVSERLPGVGDCLGRPTEESDAGWCWTYSDVPETWSFESVVFPRPYPDPPLVRLKPSVTHWLPHYALPLPQGEVEP